MQNSYERWKRQEQINFFVGFQVAQWFTALTQTGFIIVQLVGPWELFKFNEILIVCPSSVCLSLCLSGFANFCAHFYGSGAASPVCLSVWKALAPKGLCTLFQPSKIMNLFHRSLKQVVNLSCFFYIMFKTCQCFCCEVILNWRGNELFPDFLRTGVLFLLIFDHKNST